MKYDVEYIYAGHTHELVGLGVSAKGVKIYDSTQAKVSEQQVQDMINFDSKALVDDFDVKKFSSGQAAKEAIEAIVAEKYGKAPEVLNNLLTKNFEQIAAKDDLAKDYGEAWRLIRAADMNREKIAKTAAIMQDKAIEEKTWYGKKISRKASSDEIKDATYSGNGILNPDIRKEVADFMLNNIDNYDKRVAKSFEYEALEGDTNKEVTELRRQASNDMSEMMLSEIQSELLRGDLQGKYFAETGDISVFTTQEEAQKLENMGYYDLRDNGFRTGEELEAAGGFSAGTYEAFYSQQRQSMRTGNKRLITHKEMALALDAIIRENKAGHNIGEALHGQPNYNSGKFKELNNFVVEHSDCIPQGVQAMMINTMYAHRDEFWHNQEFAELAKTLQPKQGLESKGTAEISHKAEVLISGHEDVSESKNILKDRLYQRAAEIANGEIKSGVVANEGVADQKRLAQEKGGLINTLRGMGKMNKTVIRSQIDKVNKNINTAKAQEGENKKISVVQEAIKARFSNSK